MGVEIYAPYFCNYLLCEIKNLTKEKENLKIKGITAKLVDFLMSDKYIYLHIDDYTEKKSDDDVFFYLFLICDHFEKFLSIKCLFPLIEELKKSKFENQINKVINLSHNKNERNVFRNNCKVPDPNDVKLDEDWNNIRNDKNNEQYLKFLVKIATFLIDWFILGKPKITKIELIKEFFKDVKKNSASIRKLFKKEELKKLLNDLLALNYPLQYTKEINNLFIAALNFIIFSYDKLEPFNEKESNVIYYNLYHLYPVCLEIKSLIKDNKILNLKAIITKLVELYKSDKFLILGMRSNYIKEFPSCFFFPIFIICENIEKYLSIKCLFPLIEELKKSKFEEQINKAIQLSKNEKESKNFIINYYEKHKKEEDFAIEFKNYMENCNLILKRENIELLPNITVGLILTFFKYEGCPDTKLDKENLINIFFSAINECHKKFGKELKDIKELLNYLMKLDYPLEYTNETFQLFICAFNIFLSYEKMKDYFDENIVKELKKILCEKDISENNIYIIYEKKNINDKSQSKYNISYYSTKKIRDNKMSINFFEKIEKNNRSKNKSIYKNLFNDEEISEDEFNKLKNDNIEDKKINKDIKVLNDNKIINYKQKTNESEIRNEINIENKNIEISKELTEEKNKNKKLEKELKEKNKKIENLEKEVKHLKNELDKQIKINKDNEDKIALSKITFDSKDETYKALLEKDKEIKAFKEKMKRFPFELNENEKLISIIFTNSTQEFHYSIICKNTDRFSTLEAKLYDKFPQYGETANYFIANGNKVINHKTLEDNNIKDSDIIILYQFEI